MSVLAAWIIAGWLIIARLAYLLQRENWRSEFDWTRGDRLEWSILCLVFGPFGLAASIAVALSDRRTARSDEVLLPRKRHE